MLSLIVGRARNGAIGKSGDIPWFAPEDLSFFQRETLGAAVIMGRKTWDSLPKKPLPRRFNIVVTRQEMPEPESVDLAFTRLEDALELARMRGHARVYGMGGEAIYRAFLPQADRLLVTEVGIDVDGADAFFPDFDETEWVKGARLELRADAPACIMQEYLRKR